MVNYQGLTIRKLADTSEGERVVAYDPNTDQKYLVNPATGQPESWPFAGIHIEGDPPKHTMLSTRFVDLGVAEGWIELENVRVVHRPGGPATDPWRVTHTFRHFDSLTIKTVNDEDNVRYEVIGKTGQPDKYTPDGEPCGVQNCGDPDCYVEHFYNLHLVK